MIINCPNKYSKAMWMKRSYLKIGDKSSVGGTVEEGIHRVTHHGTELTFVGARVACPACESSGVIVGSGPRWPGLLMGKLAALAGDICVCKCNPPPVMIASQTDKTMSFESRDLEILGFSPDGLPLERGSVSEHWIQFSLTDAGICEGLRCRAYFADGSIEEGAFDSDNKVRFERPNASVCQKIDAVLDKNQTGGQSVMGSILMAMVG